MIVTQNIDDLHERVGSRAIRHIHGELLKSRCLGCGDVAHCVGDLGVDSAGLVCAARGRLRPHVVWFGEMPIGREGIYAELARSGMFVSVGTSGNVYPAAGFVSEARAVGATRWNPTSRLRAGMDNSPSGFRAARVKSSRALSSA